VSRSAARRLPTTAATLLLLVFAAFSPLPGQAQTYPAQVVKVIVPTTAGGTTDVLARLIADGLQARLGKPVIVENRPGAGGLIGARAAASAPPDGYSLFFGNTATLANLPAVLKSPGYDPVQDFVAVARVMESFQVLVVRSDFPAKTTQELLAYARANPGKLNFGTGGPGNITHLSGELLRAKTGVDFVPVHFRSGAESITAMLSGDVQLTIDNVTAVKSWLEAGKLRALAVTSAVRQPELPGVPTLIESGVADYVVTSFFGVVAPKGTPDAIVQKLSADINAILKTPAFQLSLAKLGGEASPGTSREFGDLVAAESRKWTLLARDAGIRIE
jgi:tripartite-type tricarboxylate transporter receptor subunit TctC